MIVALVMHSDQQDSELELLKLMRLLTVVTFCVK